MEKLRLQLQAGGAGGPVTHSLAKKFSDHYGWTPVQVDGIPEGLSFLSPDLTIGDKTHEGGYYALVPGYDLQEDGAMVRASTASDLSAYYERNFKKKNHV